MAAIMGQAYGERASLEIAGDAITWRARPSAEHRENVATTIHDLRGCRFVEQRVSLGGVLLAAAGAALCIADERLIGASAIALGAALAVHRALRVRRLLVLELADRMLAMEVDPASAESARALAARVARAIASGEAPSSPASLP